MEAPVAPDGVYAPAVGAAGSVTGEGPYVGAGGDYAVRGLLPLELGNHLLYIRFERSLLGELLLVRGAVGLELSLQVDYHLGGLVDLDLQRGLFRLKLTLTGIQLGEHGLVLGLYLLGLLAGGGVLLIAALIGLHDFAYHVQVAHQLAQAPGAKEDGEVGVSPVFLHRAHVAAVGGQLLALGLGGQLDLLALLLDKLSVERDLFFNQLYLLAVDLVLRVQCGLLLQHVGLLGFQLVYAGLHLFALGAQRVPLLLQRIDL